MQRHNMGLAVTNDEYIEVYGSDRPEEHASEARDFYNTMIGYLHSEEGERFASYVKEQGDEFIDLKGYGAADLGESTVAATIHNGIEGIIVGNYDNGKSFSSRVADLASVYGVPFSTAEEYVLTHELAHAAGYHSEESTDGYIKDFFTTMAFETGGEERRKYVQLARIAAQREQEAGLEEVVKEQESVGEINVRKKNLYEAQRKIGNTSKYHDGNLTEDGKQLLAYLNTEIDPRPDAELTIRESMYNGSLSSETAEEVSDDIIDEYVSDLNEEEIHIDDNLYNVTQIDELNDIKYAA
ncbi:MAG: hypothetical protein CMH61_02445 [Nanoarchaeota archaeon]|nr:hypothetical protein [Nanoarchaeota archaeon]